MGKFMDKLAGALGLSAEYEEEEYEEIEEEEEVKPVRERRQSRPTKQGLNYDAAQPVSYREPSYRDSYESAPVRNNGKATKVVSLQANVQMEVVVASPESLKEAKELSRSIRDNKPVVINLEFVEHAMAQRITDFLCGCCCALNGNIQRISDKIFMIAPDNVDFAGDIDFRETLESEGGLNFSWDKR